MNRGARFTIIIIRKTKNRAFSLIYCEAALVAHTRVITWYNMPWISDNCFFFYETRQLLNNLSSITNPQKNK